MPEHSRRILLHKNLPLKFPAVNFHVFVRVPRVAVLARKLAPAVRINRPIKRHPRRIAFVQYRFHRQKEILRLLQRLPLRIRRRGFGSKASNAHQWRMGSRKFRQGAIRRWAFQTCLTPAGLALGKGAGLWLWFSRAKRKELCCGASNGAAPHRETRRRLGKNWGHGSPRCTPILSLFVRHVKKFSLPHLLHLHPLALCFQNTAAPFSWPGRGAS